MQQERDKQKQNSTAGVLQINQRGGQQNGQAGTASLTLIKLEGSPTNTSTPQ